MSTGKVVELDQNTFKSEVLESDKPVLVDFWAEWCGPCKRMAPVIEAIADEHPEYKMTKVDVQENEALAAEYNILTIPAFFIFKDGELKERIDTACPKEVLLAALAKVA